MLRGLFDVELPEPNPPFPTDYAVTADGQRFLFNTVIDQPTRPALTVILNWTADFKKQAESKRLARAENARRGISSESRPVSS